MANIGTTTAFYKVETSLSRANKEVSTSMERLATGKQNANAGDRSSYVAMADTFKLDFVGTKAAIKGASVAMGYLETGMRVLDSASALLARLQELAVLGANNTNTVQDNEAINLEAEAIADEYNRLMTTSTYKGKNIFVDAANDQELAMGGRGAEMTFGITTIDYSELYSSTQRTIAGEPNTGEVFNIAHLPSDAVAAKSYGTAADQKNAESAAATLEAGKKYVLRSFDSTDEVDMTDSANDASAASVLTAINAGTLTLKDSAGTNVTTTMATGNVIEVGSSDVTVSQINAAGIAQATDGDTDVTGEAQAIDGTSGADTARFAGTYTIDASKYTSATAGAGTNTNASFTITIDTLGAATIVMDDGGDGFADDETITVAAANIGGAGANLTFDINGVSTVAQRTAAIYTSATMTASSITTSGSGTGAEFTVTINGLGAASVTLTDGGSGYADNDTITVEGLEFGNADAASLRFSVNGVSDGNITSVIYAEVLDNDNAFQSTETFVIQSLGNSNGNTATSDSDAAVIAAAFTDNDGNQLSGTLAVGDAIKMASVGDTIGSTTITQQHLDAANALIEGMTFTQHTDSLTSDIENIQSQIARARVEAGSQYAALESAVSYATDLTAMYELGYNTVHDVNFSAETAILAKNQILQQAATAMLAQANRGQQGLLQLIQG